MCCVNCGSNLVIEVEGGAGAAGGGQDDESVTVGIPVCEALDLDTIQPPGSTASTLQQQRTVSESMPEKTYLASMDGGEEGSGTGKTNKPGRDTLSAPHPGREALPGPSGDAPCHLESPKSNKKRLQGPQSE